MRLFFYGKDGGQYSTVWGYWLIEIKSLFSVVLLRFDGKSREAFHTYAFGCFSWVLRGGLQERHRYGRIDAHMPSLRPFITRRTTFHKVHSVGRSWVLSFRGPWARTWQEYLPNEDRVVTLSEGRKEVA